MTRKIVSREPVTRQAKEEKTYGNMEVFSLHVKKTVDGTKLSARLVNVSEDGEPDPEGSERIISIPDFEAQMAVTPKLKDAWDRFVDVVGLIYDFHVTREKVEETMMTGKDATEAIEARDSALAILRAPVMITKER